MDKSPLTGFWQAVIVIGHSIGPNKTKTLVERGNKSEFQYCGSGVYCYQMFMLDNISSLQELFDASNNLETFLEVVKKHMHQYPHPDEFKWLIRSSVKIKIPLLRLVMQEIVYPSRVVYKMMYTTLKLSEPEAIDVMKVLLQHCDYSTYDLQREASNKGYYSLVTLLKANDIPDTKGVISETLE